ncbi:MAG: hypothetical protein ABW252_17110 [Polyangiales bacterium]
MPIYLVRWPGAKASLVRARDEDELRLILDDAGDPGTARWTEYKGPFWLDLELPTAASRAGEARVADAAVVRARAVPLEVRFGEGEAGQAMREVVARWALPHVQAVVDALNEAPAVTKREPPARAVARSRTWRARVRSAVAADEAAMTVLAHRRRERDASPADAERQPEAMRAEIDKIAEALIRRRPITPPVLTLVRGDEEE